MTEIASEIAYLSRALKAPRIRAVADRLATQAREAGRTHEHYLAAVLAAEVTSREASGADTRIRAGGFPARKTVEEFTFTPGLGIKPDQVHHLAAGAYLAEAGNIVLLGPPGTGGGSVLNSVYRAGWLRHLRRKGAGRVA